MDKNLRLLKRLYLTSLIPNVIAVLGGTINIFFDEILVGQKLGDVGLTAVSQALPVYLFLCTLGSLFGSGASYLSSIAFGGNRREEGQRIFRAALLTSAAAGILFSGIALALASPLASLLSTAETFENVLTYIRITLAGGVLKVILYIPFFYLRLEGKNTRSAFSMVIMTVTNIALDVLFLFGLDMGIEGAAWASVIATAVACLLSFTFLFSDRSSFKPGIAWFNGHDWADVVRFGSPMALNNIFSSVRILLVQLILRGSGLEGALPIFAVINSLNEFSICIQNGVPQTASAMTGVFFGERDSDSVKNLLKLEMRTGLWCSGTLALLLCVFSGVVGKLFGSEANCTVGVICFAVSLLPATVNSILSYYFNAVGRIEMANLIAVCRGCVLNVLFCFLFSGLGGAVWIFLPACELACLLVVLLVGKWIAGRKNLSDFYLIDETFEKSGQTISFSTDCSNEQICGASDRIRDFCEENDFSSKKTMAISLAIEELLTIIAGKSLDGKGSMDVRVLKSGEEAIVRIRSGGKRYNPIEAQDGNLDYMGVQMITRMATRTEYYSSLGINSLLIFL